MRRAREGGLRPGELSGGFALSNPGTVAGTVSGRPSDAAEMAILILERARDVPERRDAGPREGRASGKLSVDHRVADGADGDRFLEDLQTALSDRELL